MNLKTEFNQYLANLAVMNFKLHNLHWNVEGEQFIAVHKYTEELYDVMFESFDRVAEHFKMYGLIPDSTLRAYLEHATIEEIEPRKFNCREALEIIVDDLEELRKEATSLRHACDEEKWFSAVSLFEEQIADYNKRLWFLKATLA